MNDKLECKLLATSYLDSAKVYFLVSYHDLKNTQKEKKMQNFMTTFQIPVEPEIMWITLYQRNSSYMPVFSYHHNKTDTNKV